MYQKPSSLHLDCRNLFGRSKDLFSSSHKSEEACFLSHPHHDESTGHVCYPVSEAVVFGAWRNFPHRHSSDAQRKLPDE